MTETATREPFASLGATKKAWTVATSIAGPREVTLGDGANAEADVLGGAVPGLLHNSDHVAALLVQPVPLEKSSMHVTRRTYTR